MQDMSSYFMEQRKVPYRMVFHCNIEILRNGRTRFLCLQHKRGGKINEADYHYYGLTMKNFEF